MNQILATEKRKANKGKTLEIKGVVRFFAIAMMIFGIVLSSEGCYSFYRQVDDRKPANIPTVTVERFNDKAIISMKHNVEISKITYHWDNGEENVIPIGSQIAQEEITLLGYDSTLYLTIEDINQKKVTYQKPYQLTGVDITKPIIEELHTQYGNNKMTITAKDETAIYSLTYWWEGEEPVTIKAESENQTEIKEEVLLTPGTKKIFIQAEDRNGNIEEIEKEILITTSIPEAYVLLDGDKIIIQAKDKDGVKDIVVNLNGQRYANRNINLKEVKVGPLQLQKGNNIISVEVTNISGYTKKASTEIAI